MVPHLVYTFLCCWELNRLRKNTSVTFIFSRMWWKVQTYDSENACHYIFVYQFKVVKHFYQGPTHGKRISSPHILSGWQPLSYCTASGGWTMWIPCCVFKLSSGPGKMSHISAMSHRYDLIPISCASKCWPCTKEKVSVS